MLLQNEKIFQQETLLEKQNEDINGANNVLRSKKSVNIRKTNNNYLRVGN